MGSATATLSSASGSSTKYTFTQTNLGSTFMGKVPDYAKITNFTISLQWKASISVGNTCKVYLNNTQVASDSTSGTSWRTISVSNLQSYCESMTANAGYIASSKIVCDGPSYRNYSLKNCVWTIYYDDPIFTVNASPNNSDYGSVSYSNGNSATVGGTVTVTATAKEGYEFVKWDDGATSATRSITVKQSEISTFNTVKTYTAIFQAKKKTEIKIKEAFMLKNDNEIISASSPIITGQGFILKVKAEIE